MYLMHKCCDLAINESIMRADDGVTIEDREACERLLVELYFQKVVSESMLIIDT